MKICLTFPAWRCLISPKLILQHDQYTSDSIHSVFKNCVQQQEEQGVIDGIAPTDYLNITQFDFFCWHFMWS